MSDRNINTPEYWDCVYRDEWASGCVGTIADGRDYAPIHQAIVDLVPDGARVLDVGCGTGLLCRKIARSRPAARVSGIDFSAVTIDRNQAADAALDIAYRCVDIRDGFGSVPGRFDVVTLCEVLEHLDDPETAVAGALALLAPGGRFILTCPHGHAIPDPEHVRTWDHDEIFHLLEPYSDTVSFVHFPPPYFHLWMMAHLVKRPTAGGDPA